MKIAELIEQLQAIRKEHGNVKIEAYNSHGDRGAAETAITYVSEGRRNFDRFTVECDKDDD